MNLFDLVHDTYTAIGECEPRIVAETDALTAEAVERLAEHGIDRRSAGIVALVVAELAERGLNLGDPGAGGVLRATVGSGGSKRCSYSARSSFPAERTADVRRRGIMSLLLTENTGSAWLGSAG